ncbi:hypothetical protein DXX94_00420 [Thalassotalea euphylliae]|uniref:Uncharacterized protein n=1 Tax=Thalassotalea euphylliae TaxID=1655234 RepID=A0A3E0U6E0_9GAMM|nr:hypothetical protein DXX94_00420 [Thalassotalea euphylliae]
MKKTGIKDENIDRQIIAIHKAIAIKLLARTELLEQVKQRLKDNRELGKINYSQFINWYSIIEMIDDPETFINAMTEDTPYMRKIRRKTPFIGILTEEERRIAIEQDAIGVTASIETLL